MSLCSVGIMGTIYERINDINLMEMMNIRAGAKYSFDIERIQSKFSIGNVLNIQLRQASSFEWVKI